MSLTILKALKKAISPAFSKLLLASTETARALSAASNSISDILISRGRSFSINGNAVNIASNALSKTKQWEIGSILLVPAFRNPTKNWPSRARCTARRARLR